MYSIQILIKKPLIKGNIQLLFKLILLQYCLNKAKGCFIKFIIVLLFLFFTQLLGSNIDARFAKSDYCIGCHKEQGEDWKTSLHSKSHMTKNTLYLKILEYIEAKKFVYKEVQALRCGKCHNPRMDAKDAGMSYSISKAFDLESEESKKIDKVLNDSTSQDGITCIVCHNVDKIDYIPHDTNATNPHKRSRNTGFQALTFGPNDVIVGPFKESHRTTYHKMKQVPHFKEEINKLCFACHHSSTNKKKVPTYTTGKEYEASKSSVKCVECHMGKQKMNVIAPNVVSSVPAIERPTRRHLFAGVRNSDIVKESLNISVKNTKQYLHVFLENTTPHKVPTGFAGRELEIEVIYKKGNKTVNRTVKKLNTYYLDRHGKETISYIANSLKDDTRLNLNETREYQVNKINGATEVQVNVWYRLVKESLIPILNIKDTVYLKKYPVYTKTIIL